MEFSIKFSYLKKHLLAAPHCFMKIFCSQQSQGTLVSLWCNNSCRVKQELNQDDFFSFDWKKCSFLSFITYPQEKSNNKNNHAYLTDSQYSTSMKYSRHQHLSQSGHLQACKTSDFFFWLIFLVISSPPSSVDYFRIFTFLMDEHKSRQIL